MKYSRRGATLKKEPGPQKTKRLALCNKTSGIGDAIALRFLLPKIKSKYPDYSLDLVLPSFTHQFVSDHSCVERVIDPSRFKEQQFSQIKDITGCSERHRAKNRIEVWAAKLGLSIANLYPEIVPAKADISRVLKLLTRFSPKHRPIVLFAPFGSVRQKSLPETKANEIMHSLEDAGWCPILLHSAHVPRINGNQMTNLNFRNWSALFSLADAVVTIATSHLWMASCFDKPTVGILGSESIRAYELYFPNLREYRPACKKGCNDPLNCSRGNRCLNPEPRNIVSMVASFGIPAKIRAPSIMKMTNNTSPRNRTGVRIQGLLGDAIKVSSLIAALPKEREVSVLLSYRDPTKHEWIKDLYSGLLNNGRVTEILPSPDPNCGPIKSSEIAFLRSRGCYEIFDGNVLSKEFKSHPQKKPDLGIEIKDPIPKRVCLMRVSTLHKHFPRRNRPYSEWEEIEEFLLSRGFYPEIIGLEDSLPNKFNLPDYRGLLSPLQSLRRALGAELVVSTATFIPVMTNHYRKTIVISDPRDIKALQEKWYGGDQAYILDGTDGYISKIKEYVEREFPDGRL